MDISDKLNFLEQLTKFSQEDINQFLLQKGKQKMVFPLVSINNPKTLNDIKEEKSNGK